MTLKQKALLQTAGIITATTVGSVLLTYLVSVISKDVLVYIAGFGLFGFLFYAMYGLVLSRLESQEILNKLSSKI